MSEPPATFAVWQAGLTAQGYTLADTAKNGSAWFVCDGKQSWRVSPWPPNEATAAWMSRTGVLNGRCQVSEERHCELASDLPEFGLETGGDGYHDDLSAINKSMADVFDDSPERYRATFITKTMPAKVPKKPLKVGLICHAILLEEKRLEEAAIAYPYSCYSGTRLSSKKAAAYEAKVAPLIAVREGDLPTIRRIVDKVLASPFGDLIRLHHDKVKREVRVDATLFGLPCKCKPDLHVVLDDQIIVADLKFGAYEPPDWERSQRKFKYWLQQAWYTLVLEAYYNRPVSWSFWAFETQPLWRGGPKDYDPLTIEMDRDYTIKLIKRIQQAYETDVWQDNFNSTVTRNSWDYRNPPSEVSAVDWSDSD